MGAYKLVKASCEIVYGLLNICRCKDRRSFEFEIGYCETRLLEMLMLGRCNGSPSAYDLV